LFVSATKACSSANTTKKNRDDKVNVTTTVGMIADIVKEVSGEYVNVAELIGSGVDWQITRFLYDLRPIAQ